MERGQKSRNAGWFLPRLSTPPGMTLGDGDPAPPSASLGLPSPHSRITGLGDEGAQLLDPVINVESPATFNFEGRGEKERERVVNRPRREEKLGCWAAVARRGPSKAG